MMSACRNALHHLIDITNLCAINGEKFNSNKAAEPWLTRFPHTSGDGPTSVQSNGKPNWPVRE